MAYTRSNQGIVYYWKRSMDTIVSSNNTMIKGVWSQVWKLNSPNHVQTLLWCARTNSLPPQANLFKRKVLSKALCQECKIHPKDTLHALWSCPTLVGFRKINFGNLVLASGSYSSFLDVIHLASMEKAKFEQFATTVSTIWMRRNKLIDGGRRLSPYFED